MKMLLGNLVLLAIFLFASKAWALEVHTYTEASNPVDNYGIIYDDKELIG